MGKNIVRVLTSLFLALSLIAASGLPKAHAGAPETSAVCRAVRWLRGQQAPDGGFGLSLPSGYRTNASATADVIYALVLVGEDPVGPGWTVASGANALDALAALAPNYVGTDAGQAGKVARAVILAGGDPRNFAGMDLLAIIEAAYDPATGRYHPSLAYRHTLAIEALSLAGITVPPEAWRALRQAQLSDGGWFWAFDGAKSDVDTTGRVLQLLAGLGRGQDVDAYQRAAAYLAALQLPGGGWNNGYVTGPANANSTALAVGGLWASGFDPQAAPFQKLGRGAVTQLLTFQEPSGAFVYIPEPGKEEVRSMATAEALTQLASWMTHRPACVATYLPILLVR